MDNLDKIQFLDLPSEYTNYTSSKYVLQQLPYEYTSSYKQGSYLGPKAILKASHYVELYDEETKNEAYIQGIATLKALDFTNKINQAALELIYENTDRILKNNKFVISLAAEHTATYPIVKAFASKFKDFSVLQIDAHADLRDEYYDSSNKLNKYSHACVMHRIHDINIPIIQAGIRALSKEEDKLIETSNNIDTFYGYDISASENSWIDELVKCIKTDKVYITIDADGLDPSIAPGVGTPEPDGLSFKQVTSLLKAVAKNKNIIGFDVVECAPIEGSIITEYTLAKVIYRLINYIEKYNNK
ncbi:MAG: agmatinase [Solitalea-like symbiont of Tyrophagus putrescentiae]